jgi:hypothetical protein
VRIENSGVGGLLGDPTALGTTYLALFKFDSVAQNATGWTLTLAQYENFSAGGLSEAALNAATTESGAMNVFERGPTSSGSVFGPLTHLNLFGFTEDISTTFDEIRLSDVSLAEAAGIAAIPEASTLAVWSVLSAMGLFFAKRKSDD